MSSPIVVDADTVARIAALIPAPLGALWAALRKCIPRSPARQGHHRAEVQGASSLRGRPVIQRTST